MFVRSTTAGVTDGETRADDTELTRRIEQRCQTLHENRDAT